ncbi:tRNA (N6-isopentenyl adenosine(37)-C2)-methylthiotransferase MiaB, partial [Patescibacteria group bacterium]|nr:tRNA (N6-isopentenyl adenosine(37)-C2)-methylthiotransferase MiaB [Patescibacteria group bacterium]
MKSFFLLTFGCQTNISDSQRIQALLQKKARCPAKDKLKADLVIINTCGVRQAPEDRVYGIVPQIRRKNPRAKIIITGCIARRKDVQKRLERFKPCFIPILEMPQYLNRLL